jgi:hypothetical protein
MPAILRCRKVLWIFAAVFLLAFTIRIKPFFYADHFFLIPVDFDEGVYYGAAVLITKGIFPYRDFDFGHPPGIAWVFSLWHWLSSPNSVSQSFALGKLFVAGMGSLTAVGIFCLGRKWNGVGAGLLAGLLYACYPEAIVSERSIFLEPFINFVAVLALLMYKPESKSWIPIGLLLAFAVSIKVTAIVWIPPFALLAWHSGRIKHLATMVAGGVAGFVVFLLPWILLHPQNFWMNVVQFQMSRPPDGDIAISLRLHSILRDHLMINIYTALGICALPWVAKPLRMVWAVLLLTVVLAVCVLLSSKGFWQQYNTLLAAPQALLASFAVVPARMLISQRRVTLVLAFLSLLIPLRSAFKGGRARDPEQLARIEEIRKISDDTCIFSFEPAWLIMADRFPPNCSGSVILDTYLVMLMDAGTQHQRFSDTSAAFATSESQTRVMERLQNSRVIVLGARGEGQMNSASKALLSAEFRVEKGILVRKP